MTDAPPRLTRRAVLAGGAAAALGAGLWAYSEESSGRPGTPPSTSTTTTTSPVTVPTPSDWARLADALDGTLVVPTSPTYDTDRLLYNSRFASLRPRAIARCASEDDVARSLAFVREHGLLVTARSGGHSYGGYSSCDGLVVDVSPMTAIDADTRSMTARVGAGAQLIDVYNVLGQSGVLVPAGSCPTVGVAGLAQGGGQGVFARRFGLTCDHLVAARVVTADGRAIVASGESHDDLWWALRGGGGGNFGVVTSFTFSVDTIPPLALFTVQFPWSAAAEVLEAWMHWVAGAPPELWSNCLLLRDGTGGDVAQVGGVYCGAATSASALVSELERAVGVTPVSRFVGGDDYLDAMKAEAGCSGLSVAACHLSSERPAGVLGHTAYAAKSSYVGAPMSAAQCARLVDALATLGSDAPSVGGGLAFDALGGAVNAVPADATAFVHRDALACIQASYSWSSLTSASEVAGGERWLAWVGAHVFDPATGAYQNYIDPTLANWARAYYGDNLARLSRVKGAYDPDNLFHFAQSIPLPTDPGRSRAPR